MKTPELEVKVIEFVASKVENIDVSSITSASKFEGLGFDSLDTVRLLCDAEDAFGIRFDNNHANTLRSVGDIVDYISKQQSHN
ncbi:MAG: acyl carrier protein [Nitrosomonas sp. PRO4]|nr:acyl carrier protein [Nitrosomonas sp. PRO4]